jgi:hypothetical protein
MKKILKRQEYSHKNGEYVGVKVDYVEVDGKLLEKLESYTDPKTGCYKDCLSLTYWEDENKEAQITDYYDEFGNKLL